MIIETNKNIKDYLYKKFNILYHTNFLNFDQDYQILFDDLNKIKKESFSNKDKIIIEQFDTDFYDDSLKTGLHTRNTVECIRSADIPFFTIMFITSNFNLDKELDLLIDKDTEGFPIVLKTVSSHWSILKSYKNFNDIVSFKKPAVCLMAGTSRSHRNSLYSFFKSQNLFSKIAVSYKNEP